MRVLGVDGCREGWVGILLFEGGVEAVVGPTVASLVDQVGAVDVVGIDIPIGLPIAGVRAADVAAQAFLGSRRATVFSTPILEALEADTLADAIAVSRLRTGRGISAQAYALRSRILEVAAWLPCAGVDVREVHPEVSFKVMSGRPIAASKRTWNGVHERVAALASARIHVLRNLGRPGAVAGVDDVLDAAAVAWSAGRVRLGEAISFPAPPEDIGGWAAAIWA